jgi:radical SAM superfamily enzyme YgiQ (UPF0313 family)
VSKRAKRPSSKLELTSIPGLLLPEGAPAGATQRIKKLDECPLPVPDGVLSFPQTLGDQKIWFPFQTRRGCPMACSYCSTATIEGKALRERSPELVVDSSGQSAFHLQMLGAALVHPER